MTLLHKDLEGRPPNQDTEVDDALKILDFEVDEHGNWSYPVPGHAAVGLGSMSKQKSVINQLIQEREITARINTAEQILEASGIHQLPIYAATKSHIKNLQKDLKRLKELSKEKSE